VDFASNTQQWEVHAVLKARLVALQAQFADLTKTDLAAFNRLLQEKGVSGIIVPAVK
jgi:glutamine synthetase adenylyltransferase